MHYPVTSKPFLHDLGKNTCLHSHPNFWMYSLWIFVWRKDEREPERTQDVTRVYFQYFILSKYVKKNRFFEARTWDYILKKRKPSAFISYNFWLNWVQLVHFKHRSNIYILSCFCRSANCSNHKFAWINRSHSLVRLCYNVKQSFPNQLYTLYTKTSVETIAVSTQHFLCLFF